MTEAGQPRSTKPRQGAGPFDLGLIALAVVYVVYVGVSGVGSDLYASADKVSDGEVWLLVTSSLEVVKTLDTVQWILLAGAAALSIYLLGPRIWWAVALIGHVGSAIISYAVIELAIALNSSSADHAAATADYGVSIVLAASLGALTAGGLLARERKGDAVSVAYRVALIAGLLGLVAMFAVSFGWYDSQHLIGYLIGFFTTRCLVGRKAWGIGDDGFETRR